MGDINKFIFYCLSWQLCQKLCQVHLGKRGNWAFFSNWSEYGGKFAKNYAIDGQYSVQHKWLSRSKIQSAQTFCCRLSESDDIWWCPIQFCVQQSRCRPLIRLCINQCFIKTYHVAKFNVVSQLHALVYWPFKVCAPALKRSLLKKVRKFQLPKKNALFSTLYVFKRSLFHLGLCFTIKGNLQKLLPWRPQWISKAALTNYLLS